MKIKNWDRKPWKSGRKNLRVHIFIPHKMEDVETCSRAEKNPLILSEKLTAGELDTAAPNDRHICFHKTAGNLHPYRKAIHPPPRFTVD